MLIDTFLLSDESEKDLLHLKFILESPHVDVFIIQENAFNLKGDHKGVFAQKILQEERFKPFHHKTVLLSANQQHFPEHKGENNNFEREKWQRTLCYDWLMQNCKDDDIVLVQDVDEMMEFDNPNKIDKFTELTKNETRPMWCRRHRMWWDFNNESNIRSIRVPVLKVGNIRDNPYGIPATRHYHDEERTFGTYENGLCWEYSYVFKSVDEVFSKKVNYAHNGFSLDSVKTALYLNTWVRPKERGEKLQPSDFFETVELTEENSPTYVREHFDELKTNIVDPNYKENRKNWTSEYT